ncbi:unnamed protein product [Linum tenue]|uniref:Uncharacterized protein n=1 Tax=Linum tenue TaxID=586396 RepID=A0AAV0P294_9ROSI|nr:unnamed protein product [Linum tenue]
MVELQQAARWFWIHGLPWLTLTLSSRRFPSARRRLLSIPYSNACSPTRISVAPPQI